MLGLNGAGKTTLLRILAGVELHDAGDVTFGTGVSGGYAQEHEGITLGGRCSTTSARERSSPRPTGAARSVRSGWSATSRTRTPARCQVARRPSCAVQLVAARHNLLLLDEPTNNLDQPSRIAVAEALGGWPGTIVP